MDKPQRVTIIDFLDRYNKVQGLIIPILKRPQVAALLDKHYQTVATRMETASFSPEDLRIILEAYKEQIEPGYFDIYIKVVTEEYEAVQSRVTEKLITSFPFSLQEFGKAIGIKYNKLMDVKHGRTKWSIEHLQQIGDFLENLGDQKYL